MFLKMCKIFSCLTFVENGCPRDYGLVFTLQFALLTSCLCYLLSQWSSRDGSWMQSWSFSTRFLVLGTCDASSQDNKASHNWTANGWCEQLCLSVGPGDCQKGCQGHHLQSWLLLGQRRFSIWVKTQGLQENWIVLSRFSCLFLSTLSCHSCCCLCFVTLIVKMYMFENLCLKFHADRT